MPGITPACLGEATNADIRKEVRRPKSGINFSFFLLPEGYLAIVRNHPAI
jgi:hypothetical protein